MYSDYIKCTITAVSSPDHTLCRNYASHICSHTACQYIISKVAGCFSKDFPLEIFVVIIDLLSLRD